MTKEQEKVCKKLKYRSGETVLQAFLSYYGTKILSEEFIQFMKDEYYI